MSISTVYMGKHRAKSSGVGTVPLRVYLITLPGASQLLR